MRSKTASGYGALRHGEAVAWGIAAALEISRRRAGLSEDDARALRGALASLGPFPEPTRDRRLLAELLARDKKSTARGLACPPRAHRPGARRRVRPGRRMARCGGYNVVIVTERSGRRRIRLFVLLAGALILASLVPLLLAEAVLIRRNRRIWRRSRRST